MICVAGKSDFSSNSFRASITPTARFISNASLSFSLAGATKYQRLFQTTNSTKQMASNHNTKTKNMSVSSFTRSTHKYPAPTRSFAAEELPQTLHPCHNQITRLYTHPQIQSNRSRFFCQKQSPTWPCPWPAAFRARVHGQEAPRT